MFFPPLPLCFFLMLIPHPSPARPKGMSGMSNASTPPATPLEYQDCHMIVPIWSLPILIGPAALSANHRSHWPIVVSGFIDILNFCFPSMVNNKTKCNLIPGSAWRLHQNADWNKYVTDASKMLCCYFWYNSNSSLIDRSPVHPLKVYRWSLLIVLRLSLP